MPPQSKIASLEDRLRPHLQQLYGARTPEILPEVLALARRYAPDLTDRPHKGWDQRDVVLITYGDQVTCKDDVPLMCLSRFLGASGFAPLLNTLHLLPFYPYSSDDGFAVIDYGSVDPELGEWDHIAELALEFDLMVDLVLNHVSAISPWFEGYKAGREPYTRYFIEVDPSQDLSMVVRPRASSLLTPVETSRGPRHVWTTFSDDQIDLNYAEPAVLLEILDMLLLYLQQGARIIRLDAIAYLWKELGTPSIHHEKTHTVVKLMRELVDAVAPGTLLLTETNVPHRENVSYFGQGDEAHMVYQFSLAPLLLDALAFGDAGPLNAWLAGLEEPPSGCTVFNFTASHDGIGVRPLEGLVPPERLTRLVEHVRARGGQVSVRQNPDGSESAYELNVSYFSALGNPGEESKTHVARFLASQALMLAMRGIPGIYFHSLVGTPNCPECVTETGRARSINRRKFRNEELRALLADRGSAQFQVADGYRRLLTVRVSQSAFHPDAAQKPVDLGHPALVGFLRVGREPRDKILVLANVGAEPQAVDVKGRVGGLALSDLLGSRNISDGGATVTLAPYQVVWLKYKG